MDLKMSDWKKLRTRLKQKYLSTPNTTEEETDGKSTIPKVRLIGEDVDKLCPNVFQVLGSINTPELKEEFIVMSSYAHLLKCLGSIIGQFSIEVDVDDIGAHFVSEIFVKLAYRFSLPFSLNTFYFAKISPFLFHILKDMFMISPTHTLGLGILRIDTRWGALKQVAEEIRSKVDFRPINLCEGAPLPDARCIYWWLVSLPY
jgi:hypothetical protein